uniref:Ig-like domain-containing protein n=1 Tax=Oreochromis aureus TaxID=47969 RepID=A0AAZ1X4F9_OREAU
MFVLIWSTLFFSVRGSNADKAASAWGRQLCRDKGYCVTLSERKLTAKAGLCVVIPCSFTTAVDFTPKHIIWYKCERPKNCSGAPIIFHSNNKNSQPEFEGRVSRLEPDVSRKNCSIIINDLKESDSGFYQLRVTGVRNGQQDGFTFNQRVNISVKGLNQKPTVMIPTLTEGQQATLTCTAPGLCSGSVPQITWTWRGAGGTESYITGNSTAFKTENLTNVTWRHVSTLTFNPSAEHHNTNVTCKIRFTGETTTEKTSGLNVNYKRKPQIIGNTTVREGDVLNLTCSVESFPPSLVMWSKPTSNPSLHNGTYTDLHNDTGSATVVIANVTTEQSGQYICTATHLDTTVTSYVNVTVTYTRKPQIIGNTTVKEGDVLNLTCSVESVPPSLVMWSKLGSNTNLHNDTGSATFIISNATAEHSGQYICTTNYMDYALKDKVNVTVIYKRKPQIIGNTTVKEGDILNLTCSVESFPPSLIMWKKLNSTTILQNGTYTVLTSDTGSATLVIQNVTAEHSGQYICTATHLDTTMTSYVNVAVTYTRKPQITGNTTIKEGDDVNLTCSIESFPPSLIKWSKLTSVTNLHNDTGSATLVIPNATAEEYGQYICTAKYMSNTLKEKVNLTVIYKRKPQIIGTTTVKKGDVLNLTCSAESFPPALIMWKKSSSNTNLLSGNYTDLHNGTGSATLVIHNVTAEYSGQYVCTAKYLDTAITIHASVTVTWFSETQDGSGCVLQSEVLTCVCISEGFPLPTIKWPLLKNHTEYSVITTVSKHTVNSTVSVTVNKHSNSTVECVSNNGNGENRENLLIHQILPEKYEQSSDLRLAYLKVTIAFLTGVLFSAVPCCLAKHCYRSMMVKHYRTI